MNQQFPAEFQQFLKDHCIDVTEYEATIPRYIRFRPGYYQQLDGLTPTSLPGFFSLPINTNLSALEAFKNGDVYGMDLASGIAVAALDVQPTDHVLDLCCAPGTKLCYISEILKDGLGTVTGVDISKHRLCTTKSVLRKHKGDRIRLFLCDGCTFDVPPVCRIGKEILDATAVDSTTSRKRKAQDMNDSSKESLEKTNDTLEKFLKPFYATRLLRNDPQTSQRLYDKVIVDAECTHDGSIMHLKKYIKDPTKWSDFTNQLTKEKLESLSQLQKDLISNGYRLCKSGGILVYSTCSFTVSQNEDILGWFLEAFPEATIEEIHVDVPAAPSPPIAQDVLQRFESRGIRNVKRFSPRVSQTSGLVVARIRKPH